MSGITANTECFISTVSISKTEVISALSRRYRENDLSEEDYSAVLNRVLIDFDNEYSIVPISQKLVDLSAKLAQTFPLKGYDCIQLSAPIALKNRLKDFSLNMIFISSDSQLCKAAVDEGFEVINPNETTIQGREQPVKQVEKKIPITRPDFEG